MTKRKLQSPSEQQSDLVVKSWCSSHNIMKEQSNLLELIKWVFHIDEITKFTT